MCGLFEADDHQAEYIAGMCLQSQLITRHCTVSMMRPCVYVKERNKGKGREENVAVQTQTKCAHTSHYITI